MPSAAPLSAGMAALLRRDQEPAVATDNGQLELASAPAVARSQVQEEAEKAPSSRKLVLRISLIAADCLLLALVMWLAFGGKGPLGIFEIGVGVVALAIGAWLTCLALWL